MGCCQSQGVASPDPRASSLDPKDLQHLPRSTLRLRLRTLGAAASEGDGLGFRALVDTVCLWNIIAELHKRRDLSERSAVLSLVTSVQLSRSVVERGLIVVKVPKEERSRANSSNEAAKLLRDKLTEFFLGTSLEPELVDRSLDGASQSCILQLSNDVHLFAASVEQPPSPEQDLRRSQLKPARRVPPPSNSSSDRDSLPPVHNNEAALGKHYDCDLEIVGVQLTREIHRLIDEQKILRSGFPEPEAEPSARDRKFMALDLNLCGCLAAESSDAAVMAPLPGSELGLKASASTRVKKKAAFKQ